MTDVLVRNIPKEALDLLKQRAARRNRSLHQQLYGIITQAAHDDVDALVDRIRERRARYECDGARFGDSTESVRRDRDR